MFRIFARGSIRKILPATTLSTFCIQDQLAKKRPQSSLYWRNQTQLSNRIFELAHSRFVDRVMNLSKILAPSEFTMYEFFLFFYHANAYFV